MKFLETAIYSVILKTCYYLEETGRKDSFERFPYLGVLAERLTEKDLEEYRCSKELSAKRYRELMVLIGGETDTVLQTAIDLCLAAMQVPEFASCLNYYTGNYVTLQLAYQLEGIEYPDYSDVEKKLKCIELVCRVDWRKEPVHYAQIEGNNRLLSYLMGEESMDPALNGWAECFSGEDNLHPMFIRGSMAAEGAEFIKEGGMVIQISGKGGRRFLSKHTARLLEKEILLTDTAKFPLPGGRDFEEMRTHLLREVFLRKGMICIYGLTREWMAEGKVTEKDFWDFAVLPFCRAGIPVIICSEHGIGFHSGAGAGQKCIELKEISRQEREEVWRGFSELYGFTVDCAGYSVRYRLSASEIAKAAKIWLNTRGTGTEDMEFSRICYEILCAGEPDTAGTIIRPSVKFSDLIVPEQTKKILNQICCGAAKSYQLYEEWNLKQKYPYGRAMTVLMAGPPGTGKTMTAHVLAGELGVLLYQVDLSHILDKYIGETEKHLEKVFDFAEKTNMLLFFDEADSMFGRRGEVTEGKDRYANMEVSYLLQRIEQYEGIIVLATNFYHNIDKAFLRRMKYVLQYQPPEKTLRLKMWKSCIPNELPMEELDFIYLAEQFEMPGGMIKNIIFYACVTALYEKKKLNMEHVLSAVKAEYEKMERNVDREFWGKYGHLMLEEREEI